MHRATSKDVPPTLQQLKERGDRAIAEAGETVLRLRVCAYKSAELREQIASLHDLDLKLPQTIRLCLGYGLRLGSVSENEPVKTEA
jgi:hypothetical protein